MTNNTSWMPRPDLALVFTTVFVIVLANLPAPVPHQVVEVSNTEATDTSHTYSLAVNDPRLRRLTRRIDTYGKSAPAAAVGKAKWMAETSSIYAERTLLDLAKLETQSDEATSLATGKTPASSTPIMMVSYVKTPDAKPTPTNLVEYWSNFSKTSEKSIETIRTNWQKRIASLGPPPVKLAGTVPGVISGGTIYVASILAIFATLVMATWRSSYPTRRLQHPVAITTEDHQSVANDSGLAITLPAGSVRLHQPMMVHLRRMAYAGLIVIAILQWL
ncbi:hypothetical protein [Rubripirellula reticaptiva]|nr:hypothetical protein [Rubripirellula reticaptiva]